jgi:hypothetical protein
MNGALNTRLGGFAGRVRAAAIKLTRSGRATELPWIGSSLQLWVADDGCRAVVAIHNTFPQYSYYLDGWKVEWADAPGRDFRHFDGYQIDVDWQPVLAFAVYRAMGNYRFTRDTREGAPTAGGTVLTPMELFDPATGAEA